MTRFSRFVGALEHAIGAIPVIGFLIREIGRNWWRLSDWRRLLWACRAQLLSVAVGGGLIALTDQARDIVIASAAAKGGIMDKVGLVATLLLWAGVSWYWARVTLNFSFALPPLNADPAVWDALDPAEQERRSRWREFWRRQVPRGIGAGSIVLVSAAYCKAGRVYKAAGSQDTIIFFFWSALFLAIAVAFYVVVAYRAEILSWVLRRPPAWFLGLMAPTGPSDKLVRTLVPQGETYNQLRDYANPVAIFFLGGSLLLAPLLSGLFIAHPVGMSDLFGDAVRAILVGLAVMVPIMSLLALISQTYRVPVFGLVILWMIVAPQLTRDNHNVRTIAEKLTPEQVAARAAALRACGTADMRKAALGPLFRPTLDEAFDKWLAVNQAWAKPVPTTSGGNGTVSVSPFIVVATAGGASRAAFWTSQVLSHIAGHEPHFNDQLFMISGVSGGSLGAVAFRSMVEANRRQTAASPKVEDFAGKARGFLEHDFLTPAMATGLYVDLPFHALSFLPQSLQPNDRAAALEKAWEGFASGYVDLHGDKGFAWSDGFLATFGGDRPWPILALNGTSVEKGKRIVFSNADFACTDLSGPITRYDGVSVLGADVPISTAATMSARFPVISPTGGMVDRGAAIQMRVTDGGLFENFGAVTAEEVLRHIVERRKDVQAGRVQLAPIAILISSDPSLDVLDAVTNTGRVAERATGKSRNLATPDCNDKGEGVEDTAGNHWPECPLHPLKTATVLVDPALALYDGRTARGEMAAVSLMDRIAGSTLLVRDRLAQALLKGDPAKNTDKALADAGNFLGTRNHLDFFHFRQCRVPGLKSPTMSWHDSDEAWVAMRSMTGVEPEFDKGDPCGNGAEFFRLCTRLARLTGAAANDVAASDYCDKKTNPDGPKWERPKGWECRDDGDGSRMCGIYK